MADAIRVIMLILILAPLVGAAGIAFLCFVDMAIRKDG